MTANKNIIVHVVAYRKAARLPVQLAATPEVLTSRVSEGITVIHGSSIPRAISSRKTIGDRLTVARAEKSLGP